MDLSKFKDGRPHFGNLGEKDRKDALQLEETDFNQKCIFWPAVFPSENQTDSQTFISTFMIWQPPQKSKF